LVINGLIQGGLVISWNPLTWFDKTEKVINIADKFLDGAMSGIDKLVFTDQEKVEFSQAAGKAYLEHQKVILKENTAKSITRRILAVMVMGTFLLLLVFSVGIYTIDPEWSKFSLQVASTLSTGFTAIIVFYFGYYAIGNLMDKRNGK